MYSKVRKFLIVLFAAFLGVTATLYILLQLPEKAYADTQTGAVAQTDTEGYVESAAALTAFDRTNSKIPAERIISVTSAGGSMESYPVDNIKDGSNTTFWYSAEENSDGFKNAIEVTFDCVQTVGRIYYATAYFSSPAPRQFAGYPTKLNVYAASGNEEYRLAATIESQTESEASKEAMFNLPKAVQCDRIKLEYEEVTVVQGLSGNWTWLNGKKFAASGDIQFYLPKGLMNASQNATGNYSNTTYLSANSVMAGEMKFRANGAGEIGNAFDKNMGTYWTSESANTELFKNKVTITFNSTVNIEKIVMGLSYYTRNGVRNYSGFPKQFKIYTAADSESEVELIKIYLGTPDNWNMALFDLGGAVTCKKMVLEFTDVTAFEEIAGGAPVACTSEIFLVRGADDTINDTLETINGIFADYAQLSVKPEYTEGKIAELRASVQNYAGYESTLKPILDRAEAVLNGAIRKDIYREFSTDENAKNHILQMGDLRNYCYQTLKHSSFGTNRQVTGIAANTGEKLTIYVDAEDGVPLPKIACTQIYGAWNSWKAEYQLRKGKNEITFPNLKAHGNYSRAIAPGGPLHIINNYTKAEQTSEVKVYIEGGALYPVFRDGDDEATFKMILENYYSRLTDPNDSGVTVDCFEAVTGNVMLSCTASLAYNSYVKGGSSPQFNIDKWRDYITGLLKFGGIEFEEGKPHYDERNKYIKVNIRAVQPYAGMYAFAAADHVGIIDSATFGAMVQKWTTGWAFAHEIGHMLDNMNMKWAEVTNNMWAIYDIYMLNGAFNDRINVTAVSQNLASDFSASLGNYWPNGNCAFWWIIEGGHPGYWAKLQQLYCFDTRGNDIENRTERLAYYSSLATGEDMTEYFERWGFYLNGNTKFIAANASAVYNQKIAEAKSNSWITGGGKKFWYVNNEQYRQEKLHDGKLDPSWAACYNGSQTVSASDIRRSENGYLIMFPDPANAAAHLCYEVQSYIGGEWKVLGVTYGTAFSDTYAYASGTTPRYRFYAYDRMFNCTGTPAEQSPAAVAPQFEVCRIGDVKYNSLKEAVAAATDGATIYLLKDFSDGGILINKNLKILVDPSVEGDGVTVTKNTDGVLINVVRSSGNPVSKVEINAKNETKKIILDGGEFWQSGSLLKTNGIHYGGVQVWAYNTVFRNNWNNNNGGALYLGYVGQFYLIDCEVKDNRAKNGGGAYLEGSNPGYGRTQFALFNVLFENNVASGNGGAIYSSSVNGTVFTVNSTSNNDPAYSRVIIRGNRAVNGGGIYADNIIELRFLTLENNVASGKGGGVYFARVNNVLNTVTVRGNASGDKRSNAFYLGGTTLTLTGGEIGESIERTAQAVLNLSGSMPDFTGATFYLPAIPAEGMTLINAVSGFTPTEEQINAIKISNGLAKTEGTAIKAVNKMAAVTVIYGGQRLSIEAAHGAFTLPERFEGLPSNKYVENYNVGGKTYNVGEVITVTGDLSVTANVKDYCVITLEYGGKTTTLKVTQNYVYYLPMKTPDGDVVFGWKLGSEEYAYAEGVEITGNVTLKAIVKAKFTVVTDILGETVSAEYDYCSSFTLPTPPLFIGKAFSHWEVNGKNYPPNTTLAVMGNFRAVAHYTSSWNVTRVIEDNETVTSYKDGTVIIFDKPAASLGREFVYWSVGGTKYYAGASYTVTSDIEMQAVFMTPERLPEKVTLTLVYNKGAESGGDGEISENVTEEVQVGFNSVYVFKNITVHEGYELLYWEVNGAKYMVGDRINVTASFTANACVVEKTASEPEEGKVKVTLSIIKNGELSETTYNGSVGEKIYLGEMEDFGGKNFSHWEVNGKKVTGNYFTVEGASTVRAVYESANVVDPDGGNGGNGGNGGASGDEIGISIGIIVGALALSAVVIAVAVVVVKRKNRQ